MKAVQITPSQNNAVTMNSRAGETSGMNGSGGSGGSGGSLQMLHRVRDAVRTQQGVPGAWAGGIASLVHEALVDHHAIGDVARARVIVEVIEPGTGRCLEIGSSKPQDGELVAEAHQQDPSQLRTAERPLMEVASSGAGVMVRAFVQGVASLNGLGAAGELDVRLTLTVAAETFAEHIVKPERRRRQLAGKLTESQQRVLALMLNDLSEREIGEKIGRSPHTVHDHVKAIYACLGISSRTELLALWYGGEPLAGRNAV